MSHFFRTYKRIEFLEYKMSHFFRTYKRIEKNRIIENLDRQPDRQRDKQTAKRSYPAAPMEQSVQMSSATSQPAQPAEEATTPKRAARSSMLDEPVRSSILMYVSFSLGLLAGCGVGWTACVVLLRSDGQPAGSDEAAPVSDVPMFRGSGRKLLFGHFPVGLSSCETEECAAFDGCELFFWASHAKTKFSSIQFSS